MNIQIKFEDTFGCKTLFKESTSILNGNNKIDEGNGNTKIFRIDSSDAIKNDYIILIFDLDSQTNESLTSEELKYNLKRSILNEDTTIKTEYQNKIVLVPVFFCYETLYFYSKTVQNTIATLEQQTNTQNIRLLKLYKSYYDYSLKEPEDLDGIASIISEIQLEASKITGEKSTRRWYPQRFHITYSKQLLITICKNISNTNNIFEKHEERLFNQIKLKEPNFDIQEILEGLHSNPGLNIYLDRIFSMKDTSDLQDLTIDKTLNNIYTMLDTYNQRIKSTFQKATHITNRRYIEECKSNIESEIQFRGNTKKDNIITICKKQGYTEDIINQALEELHL